MESNQKASGDGLTGTQKEAALRALVQRTGYLLQQVWISHRQSKVRPLLLNIITDIREVSLPGFQMSKTVLQLFLVDYNYKD